MTTTKQTNRRGLLPWRNIDAEVDFEDGTQWRATAKVQEN